MALHNLLSAVRIAEPLASCSAIYWQKKNTTNQENWKCLDFSYKEFASWQNPAFRCCKPLYFTQVVCLFLDLFSFIHMDSWNSLLTSLTFTMRLERCILQTFRHYLFFSYYQFSWSSYFLSYILVTPTLCSLYSIIRWKMHITFASSIFVLHNFHFHIDDQILDNNPTLFLLLLKGFLIS